MTEELKKCPECGQVGCAWHLFGTKGDEYRDLLPGIAQEWYDDCGLILQVEIVTLHFKQAERIKEREDALQGLYDEQNGPPLIRDADSWQRAMDKAGEQLKGKEAK